MTMKFRTAKSQRRAEFDRIFSKLHNEMSAVLGFRAMRRSTSTHRNVDRSNPSTLLDSWEAADMLGVAKHTLDNWRTAGEPPLPFVRVGKRIRYRVGDLDAYVAQNVFASTSEYRNG
jgi:excisionase family DNA binding protein